MEFAGRAHRILTDHGVGDEEHFAGRKLALEQRELVHQFVVDVQAAGSVHKDDVAGGELGFAHGAANDFERLIGARAGPEREASGLGHLGELLARRGAIDVRGDDDGAVAVLHEPFGELAGRGGLAGTLQANQEPNRRRTRSEKRLGVLAEESQKLVADDFDDLLIGRELEQDFAAKGFFADVGEKLVHDADGHVAFEHGLADFAERGVQVLLGELALAAEVFEDALELFGKVFKHRDLFPVTRPS